MSAQHNKFIIAIIEKHIALWNDTNEVNWKAVIAEVYATDIKIADPATKYKGQEEANTAIVHFQQQFAGALLRLKAKPIIHHNGGYYIWELVKEEQVLATGIDFIMLKDDLIRTLYIFIDAPEG